VPPALKPAPTNPPPMTVTSTPAPAVANEVKPPDDVSLMRPGGVSGQLKINAALLPGTNAVTPPSEGSGWAAKAFWPWAWPFWRWRVAWRGSCLAGSDR